MNDQTKTMKGLTEEISSLRQRIRELEAAVSDRQQVEDMLRETIGKFQDLAEKAIVGIYLIQDNLIKYANGEFANIFGYDGDEIADRLSPKDLIHPDDLPVVSESIRSRIAGERKSHRYEFRIVKKGGEVRQAIVFSSRTFYHGQPAVIGTVLDVTDQKQTEEALRNRESYLSAIIENQPGSIWLKDKEGRYLAANQVFVRACGKTAAEEIVGLTDRDLWPPERADESILGDIVVMKTGKPIMLEEPFKKDGRTVWWEKFKAPVRDAAGNIIGTTGYVHDITERKQAIEALRQSEEKHRTILESIDEAYVEIDLNGRVTFCSDPACRITGYSRNELMSMDFRQYTSPETAKMMRAFFNRIFLTGERSQISDFELIGKDGRSRRIEMSVNLIRDTAGETTGFRYIARDVTDRSQAETDLRESQRKLSQIIEFLPDATFVIDLNRRVIFWNRAMEELSGVKAQDMLGKDNYEYAVPFYGRRRPMLIDLVLDYDHTIEQTYDAITKREKDLIVTETWVSHFRGTGGFLWGTASPLYDGQGQVFGAIESIRDVTDRRRAEETLSKRGTDLEKKTSELEDLNAALRVLLNQRANDRKEFEDQITSNIRVLILPQIEILKEKLKNRHALTNVHSLEDHLKDIIAPFVRKLSSKYLNLTNREFQIATLIQEGKVTKEITEILGISEGSVNIHRYSIRKKLKLSKKDNLRAYLSSLDPN